MLKPRNIYIATSERLTHVGEKLRDMLRTDNIDADIWRDAIGNKPSQLKIETLEQMRDEYDFAVVFLSKNDILLPDQDDNLKLREDCAFEAGFLAAAIGRNRCMFIKSIGETDTPLSNLDGLCRYSFIEPEGVCGQREDYLRCTKALEKLMPAIKDNVERVRKAALLGGSGTGVITREELLAREQFQGQGGQLIRDQVVVASGQARELDLSSAKRVRSNLDIPIQYVYFVQGNRVAADQIPRMLQTILLAKSLAPGEENLPRRRVELVKDNSKKLLEDLNDICTNDKLNVFFLSERLDWEYCIHNADNRDFAKMYAQHEDSFIEWSSGPATQLFWLDKKVKKGADCPEPPDAVFHAGTNFDFNQEAFHRRLQKGMQNCFGEI